MTEDKPCRTAILGIPLGHNSITFPFFQSVLALMAHELRQGKAQRFVGWLPEKGAYVHKNRNMICHNFLEHTQADYLWFVDSDIEFAPDTLQKMASKADELDADVLACPYLLQDGSITFYAKGEPGHYISYGEVEPDAVYDLDSAGTGNMLIHRRVLLKLRERYKGIHRTGATEWGAHWFAHDRDGDVLIGEDHTFCNRVKREGFSIKGWFNCLTEHWKSQPVRLPPPPEPHPADLPEDKEESRIVIP